MSKRFSPKVIFNLGKFCGLLLVIGLTGCVDHGSRPAQGSVYEDNSAVFLVQDDYVYYPSYQCYYSASQRRYAYRDHDVWVARPAPPGATINVLQTSPSVRMNFHDSPANHHAVIVKQYPRNWKDNPPGGNQNH